MLRIRYWLKQNGGPLLLFVALFAFLFSDFLFGQAEYNIGYDIKNHFVPFYTEFRRLLTSQEMPFWSFDFFLGTNVLASKSYYFISDFFAYFIFLFPSMEILDVMLIMQFAKCLVAYWLMNRLLQELHVQRSTAFLFSLLYAFSSFTFIFLGIPMFLSFAAFLPLLFLSIERYLKKGTFLLISLSSFLLICSSYYLFWSVSVFLLFAWPIRYFLSHEWNRKAIKPFLLSTLKVIFFYVLGALLYAPILFPTIDYMLQNSRVIQGSASDLFWSKKIYLDMFIKAISAPFYVNTEIPNYFGTQYYRTDQIALYSSVLTVLLVPQLFTFKRKKTKWLLSTFYGICFLLLFFQPGGSLMHGFSEASFRWTLMIILSNLVLSAVLWDRALFQRKILLITILGIFLGVGLVFGIVQHPMAYAQQTVILLITLGFLILEGILLAFFPKKRTWLIGLVLIEIAMSGKLTLHAYLEKNSQTSYHYDEKGIPMDYFEQLQEENGQEFYRIAFSESLIDIDHQADFNYNSNMVYGFPSVSGYDSTYQTSLDEFLNWTGQYFWWFQESDYRLQDFLSVKYLIVRSPYELPHENYTLIEQIGDSPYLLYHSNQAKPFGFTCNLLTSTEDFYQYTYIYDIYELIANTIIVDQAIIEENHLESYIDPSAEENSLQIRSFSNNHIEGTIDLEQKQILLLTIPYDRGWSIQVDKESIEPLIVNGGFMAIPLEEGDHQITLDFIPYGWKSGWVAAGIALTILLSIFISSQRIKKRIG